MQIPVGIYVYCYSNSEITAKSGANWVVEKLNGKCFELPVYIDMEDDSIKSLGREKLTNICIAFNSIVESTNRWAGVYANKNWLDNYLDKNRIREKYTIWIAHYGVSQNKYENEYDMLQYSESGKVDGINGKSDMNVMYRDLIGEIKQMYPINDFENTNNNENIDKLIYRNGNSVENVYADTNLTKKIGSLNPGEIAECLSVDNDRPLIRYKIDGTDIYKCGYVKWKGGLDL